MSEWMVVTIIISSMLLLFFTGLPVSFSLIGVSALLMLIFMGPQPLFMLVAATANQISQEVFLAIPLFVLMAAILQFAGVAEDLYKAMYPLDGAFAGRVGDRNGHHLGAHRRHERDRGHRNGHHGPSSPCRR
jgi:TRAP-type mannitol/chloroaromatic compound transport system permease large subunit